jgi:hypothetical protein
LAAVASWRFIGGGRFDISWSLAVLLELPHRLFQLLLELNCADRIKQDGDERRFHGEVEFDLPTYILLPILAA